MNKSEFNIEFDKLVNRYKESLKKESLLKYPMNLQIYNKARAMTYPEFCEWFNFRIELSDKSINNHAD